MILATDLTKSFGGVQALRGVSLELASGGVVSIIGPSGCGKTTFLRLLAGLEEPDAGEIWLDGVIASRPGWVRPPHQRGIGFVFQESALWPHLTVAQNVLFGLGGLERRAARHRAEEVLGQVGLEQFWNRYPHQLSGGEGRRVALARALAPRPRRLLMDEPLSNLDEAARIALLEQIRKSVTREGASLVYVTHDLREAREVGGRCIRMRDGRFLP